MQTVWANVHVHVERVFGASNLGWLDAPDPRGDHSSLLIITIKTEGSACANPSVDDDATGSD